MVLLWLVLIPLLAGVLCLFLKARSRAPRRVASGALGLDLLLKLSLWTGARPAPWWYEFDRSWIPDFGISLHLALDGLSLAMLLLTFLLGLMAVLASSIEIEE